MMKWNWNDTVNYRRNNIKHGVPFYGVSSSNSLEQNVDRLAKNAISFNTEMKHYRVKPEQNMDAARKIFGSSK